MPVNMNSNAEKESESDLLEAINALRKETEVETTRIKNMHYAGQLTPDKVAEEFAETFSSLLRDFAHRLFEVQYMAQRFGDDVAQKLWPDGDDAGGIWPEDARVFKMLLGEYRDILKGSLENVDGDVKKVQEAKINLIENALVRLDELTLEEDDDHEADGDDAEDEDEDDDEGDEDKPN